MCDVIALTVKARLKERGNIKREQGKDGEEKEKFLPGALHVPELRRQGLRWFCFCVCVLSPPETSPSLLVPMRKPKQETSFNSTSSHHVLCRAQRQTLCRMGHGLQQNCRRAEAGKPIWTKAEDPNKSPGKSETYWRAPSPKRHLCHPVCISTLGKRPRMSSSVSAPFGMKFATKWISRDRRIDSAYLFCCSCCSNRKCPSFYSLCYQSNKNMLAFT